MERDEYRRMFEAEDRHWWYVSLHELILETIEAEYAAKGPLAMLDAGCGTGRLLQLLETRGTTEGIDASDEAVAFCGKRGLGSVRRENLNTADLGGERFDVITSIDVLYHRDIADEAEVLNRIAAALRPDGIVIVNLPAYEFLRGTHDRAVHTRKRYRRAEVVDLLAAAGLAVERATYRVWLLLPPIVVYRTLGKFLAPGGSAGKTAPSDTWLPPDPVNRLLMRLMRCENKLLRYVRLPFGTSVFAVARKPA